MRFICTQPATTYFIWQVEVMLFNFKEMGVNLNHVDVVCAKTNETILSDWLKLSERYGVHIYFYDDTRKSKKCIYSIRGNLLKQHFKKYPELKNEIIFYHDSDIIFTRPIDFSQFERDDIWYGSNTNSYISYEYIVSESKELFDKMVEVVDIDPNLIIDNSENSIGAQYILKGVDSDYWKRVEEDTEKLELNAYKFKKNKIFTFDMWSILWNGWKMGKTTKSHHLLNFCFPSANENAYHNCPIMHNATIDYKNNEGLFNKSDYRNLLPYNLNLKIKDNTASKKYYEWVQRVEKVSVLINNNKSFI